MIFRRRRVRIEIEHSSLRLETVTEVGAFGAAPLSEPETTSLAPQIISTPEAPAPVALPLKQETRS